MSRAEVSPQSGRDTSPTTSRRWGRRALAASAFLTLAVVGSCLVWWGTSLRSLPDIGQPFDLSRYGKFEVAESENAWTYYREAVARLTPSPKTPWARGRSWSLLPTEDREWTLANRDALEIWYMGTTKDRCVYIQPRDLRMDTALDVAQNLRTVNQLALYTAAEREDVGDFAGAWRWYKAALRASRHCGTHGTIIERLIGIAMYTNTAGVVRAWSDNPKVNVETLRSALQDLIAINAMTPRFADWIRSEYFAMSPMLEDPDVSVWSIQHNINNSGKSEPRASHPGPMERIKEAVWRVGLREPERSRRVLRLIYANWLSVGDLTDHERAQRRRKIGDRIYFDPPDDAPGSARLFTPAELDRWLRSTRYLDALLFSIEPFEKASDREAALQASLVVHLAERLYAREHGAEPPSVEALVGPYLKAIPPGYVPPETPKPDLAGAPR